MRYYEATSRIAASPDAVWAVLTDGAAWSQWDSGVDGVDGRIARGQTVRIRSQAASGRVIPVNVTAFEPPRRLRFSRGTPLGLLKGLRTYSLSPDGAGATTFHMREEDTRPLLALIRRSMADLGPSLTQFAEGLKRRVESGS